MNDNNELSMEDMEKIIGGLSCYKQLTPSELKMYSGMVKAWRTAEFSRDPKVHAKADELKQSLDNYTKLLEEKYKQ